MSPEMFNLMLLFFAAKDLCRSFLDNDCDEQSTECSLPGDGTFYCSCKPGFRRWIDLTNICQGKRSTLI